MRLTDTEFNLISRYTSKTHLDGVIDITGNENDDFFYDFEEDKEISLQEGFEIVADSVAYPFSHEGFTADESIILEKLIKKFVPNFEVPKE